MQLDTIGKMDKNLMLQMQKYSKIINFAKKEILFDSDDTMEYFYIFLGGKVKISQLSITNGKEQTIYLMDKGDMYDTVALLDGKVHDLIVEVLEDGTAMKIPMAKAREWMYDYPVFGEIVLKYVASQLRKVEELVADLTLLNTQERLMKLILHSLERVDKKGRNILDGLSHTEIANLIGTVRHVVDRHIKKLKAEGVLEDERRKITLKDREKLLDRIRNI